MSPSESRTAIVFVHGVGVQDRFQQLTEVAEGLTETPVSSGARFKEIDPKNRALDGFVPLEAIDSDGSPSREADLHEIYWAPMLNGKTNPLAVLRWTSKLLWRSLVLVSSSAPSAKVLAGHKRTPLGKWLFTIFFLFRAVSVAAAVFWLLLNGVALSLDQTAYFKNRVEEATLPKTTVSRLAGVPAKDVGLLPGVDYGPGQAMVLRGVDRLPVLSKPSDTAPLESVPIRLKLDPFGKLAEQNINAAPAAISMVDRGNALWTFVWTSFSYLPKRNPNMPPLAFADFVSGTRAVGDVQFSQIVSGIAFLGLSAGFFVFGGRTIGLYRNRLRRKSRGYETYAVKAGRPKSEAMVDRLQCKFLSNDEFSGRYRRAVLTNLLFTLICFGLALLSGNFVSHVTAYLLASLVLLRVSYVFFGYGLVNVAGDVEVYTTRNENSEKFAAREGVLNHCVEGLQKLLASNRYDQVILIGHSLGSVIGLEAIRRIYSHLSILPEDAPEWEGFHKLRAFVTIGSPLEKTRLYFQRNDYKSRYAEFSQEIDLRIFGRENLEWRNYWMWDDIVSDPLATYPVGENLNVELNESRRFPNAKFWSHSDYWHDPRFVSDIAKLVLSTVPSGQAKPLPPSGTVLEYDSKKRTYEVPTNVRRIVIEVKPAINT